MLVDSTSLYTFFSSSSSSLKMESFFKCRICSKSFFNRRALVGHMRSHKLSFDETESDVSSSSYEEQRKRKSLEDDESESESSMNVKRTKKSQLELEPPHSSASDTTTEEDLAVCLMMLSRDKWKKNKTNQETLEESEGYNNKSSKIKRRYKCETCEKVFKSYQALGGHRASHKKKNNNKTEHVNVSSVQEKRIHECPICFRVFASGQALGGHKRSHGISVINRQVNRMIDLNLPPPSEDQDGVFQ